MSKESSTTFHSLNSFYMITTLDKFSFFNRKLLEHFEKMPNLSYGNVTKTDWSLSKEETNKKTYVSPFLKKITPYYNKLAKQLSKKWWGWRLGNIWFQQYNQNSDHHWHVHWYSNWTNVYYVELPDKSITTQLYDILRKKIIDIKLREGQLLTFPAHIMHRSPINKSKERKTVISFNTNINMEKA